MTEHLYAHTHEIVTYIKTRWNITYSVPGLNKWLHQHGFSYKKPKGVPHKADTEKQDAFIERYTDLKERVCEDEPIIFIDAVHPTQATKLSYGWIKTGTDKAIKTTGSRTRINLIGAIRLGDLSNTVTATRSPSNVGFVVIVNKA